MKSVKGGKKAGLKYFGYGIAGLVILLVLTAAGISLYYRSANYVATVGNEKITRAEFTYILNVTKRIVMQEYGINSGNVDEESFWNRTYGNETILDYVRREALGNFKSLKVEYIKAREQGITLDDEDLQKVDQLIYEDVLKHFDNKKEADEYCREVYGITVDELREIYKLFRYRDKLKERIIKDLNYGESDLKAYYDNNPDKFMDTEFRKKQEEAVWVRHILVKNYEGDDPETKLPGDKIKEAEAKAREILDKVKGGKDFDELLEEYADDEAVTGGDYIFVKGQMHSAFEDVAFNKLKPGQISGIVETDLGFHIIKLEEKIPEGKPVSFRAAKEYHEFGLNEETLAEAYYQSLLDSWNREFEMRTNYSVYEKIK